MKDSLLKTIGIDASNIRAGGGITHLSQIIEHAEPQKSDIFKVIVWSSKETLNKLPNKDWLVKKTEPFLQGGFFKRTFWQTFILGKRITSNKCDILFVPGGSYRAKFNPVVSMHQNLLPFEKKEILRYGFSLLTIKWILLSFTQSSSFKKSNGIIFLSQYSKKSLLNIIDTNLKSTVVPHGIESRFFKKPRKQKPITEFNDNNTFKIIYVSTIDFYKHQWNVVEAVGRLRDQGFPVELSMYGSSNPRALDKLNKTLKSSNHQKFIRYYGELDFSEIEEVYFSADLSIFASSCETFGQIVLESMAAGLPLACSEMSSLPEIVEEGAVLFNPLSVDNITETLRLLIESPEQRLLTANKAYGIANKYSWYKSALSTFNFLKEIADLNRKST